MGPERTAFQQIGRVTSLNNLRGRLEEAPTVIGVLQESGGGSFFVTHFLRPAISFATPVRSTRMQDGLSSSALV